MLFILSSFPSWLGYVGYYFFVMLLVLGVDSEFCNVEALVTGIVDNWPDQLLKHRRLFTVCLCLFLFCLGVPLVTNVSSRSLTLIYYH